MAMLREIGHFKCSLHQVNIFILCKYVCIYISVYVCIHIYVCVRFFPREPDLRSGRHQDTFAFSKMTGAELAFGGFHVDTPNLSMVTWGTSVITRKLGLNICLIIGAAAEKPALDPLVPP